MTTTLQTILRTSPERLGRIVERLLLLYVIFLPLRRFPFIPIFEPKFEPTEYVFLLLGPLAALYAWRKRIFPRPGPWGFGIAYLASLTVATFGVVHIGSYLELIGRYYLLIIAVITAGYVSIHGDRGLEKILRGYALGGAILGASAYIGYLLLAVGVPTTLLNYYENFPYFGSVYRAVGTARGATTFVLVSIIPAAYSWQRYRVDGVKPWFLLLLFPMLVMSFSKEILLLVVAVLFVDPIFRSHKRILAVISVAASLTYVVSTHYIFQPLQPADDERAQREEYVSGNTLYWGENFRIAETSYVSLKRASLILAAGHQPFGLGADQFYRQLGDLADRGLYPEHLPHYAPHSTYLGTLAEAGILGLGAILAFFAYHYRRLRLLLRRCHSDHPLWVFAGFLYSMTIVAISFDVLHLRFLWVPVGAVVGAGIYRKTSFKRAA